MTQSFIKPASPYIFGDFQTACPQLVEALKKLEQICKTDLNVVLKGKSGTGKERIYESLYLKTHRWKCLNLLDAHNAFTGQRTNRVAPLFFNLLRKIEESPTY